MGGWRCAFPGAVNRRAFAAQWLMDGSVPAQGRRAWACARRSVAGIGLPVSERRERRASSSASPAALACPAPDGGAAGRGLSGVFRCPGFPTMCRADGGRVTAAIPGNGTGGRAGALARSGRRAAAGLLLAFAALLAPHLQAQAQTTYVSNLNQTGTGTGLDAMHGQSFTTGDQAGGYQLGSVAVRMHYLAPGTTMTVSIYNTDTNGYPTTLKYALTAPSMIPSDSTVYFAASTGATLDAGTTYSVVFDVSATTFFYVTASDAEDTAEAGWSIADVVAQKTNSVWADRLHAQFSVQLAIIGPSQLQTPHRSLRRARARRGKPSSPLTTLRTSQRGTLAPRFPRRTRTRPTRWNTAWRGTTRPSSRS